MRAKLEKRQNYWVVIDKNFDTVVLTTENRSIAQAWHDIVNACKHNRPYDILWHSIRSMKI